jgi:hypothetical protein
MVQASGQICACGLGLTTPRGSSDVAIYAKFFMELRRTLQLAMVALAMLAVGMSATANAGRITNAGASFGDGLGFVLVATVQTPVEGVDNVDDSGNLVVPIKRFDHNGVIDIEFFVDPSNPNTTEYLFIESVDNNTLLDWSGYVIELGFGTGENFARAEASVGLDFDAPDYTSMATSTAFSDVDYTVNRLTFSGGTQDTGSRVYTFRVDVPSNITYFTLRQYPIPVPEPGTMALAATGLVGLLVAVRRSRRH